MYAAIWRRLPGPRWLKAAQAAVLILVGVAVLFAWLFPALATAVPLLGSH